jgi:pre-mRNA-processing factor 40
MLGQAGSTPLELFWDVVEQLDTDFRLKRDYVLDVLEEKRFEVTETTNFEEFKSLMSSEPRTSMIPAQLLERIFTNLVNKFRRYSSRQSRKKPDAFRSLLRHLSEVTYDSTWEIIRPLVAEKEEFKALESEEERVAVFDKVIRRLKEKRDEERKYRERDESTRVSKRERGESVQRDGLHESKSRRRYEDDEWERSRDRSQPRSPERSRPRSRDRKDRSRDRDPIREREKERYRDRSRGYSRRDELDYEEPSRDRSKRRSDNDLRAGERKVSHI